MHTIDGGSYSMTGQQEPARSGTPTRAPMQRPPTLEVPEGPERHVEHWAHVDENGFHMAMCSPQIATVRSMQDELMRPALSPDAKSIMAAQDEWYQRADQPTGSHKSAIAVVRHLEDSTWLQPYRQASSEAVSRVRSIQDDSFTGINDPASVALAAVTAATPRGMNKTPSNRARSLQPQLQRDNGPVQASAGRSVSCVASGASVRLVSPTWPVPQPVETEGGTHVAFSVDSPGAGNALDHDASKGACRASAFSSAVAKTMCTAAGAVPEPAAGHPTTSPFPAPTTAPALPTQALPHPSTTVDLGAAAAVLAAFQPLLSSPLVSVTSDTFDQPHVTLLSHSRFAARSSMPRPLSKQQIAAGADLSFVQPGKQPFSNEQLLGIEPSYMATGNAAHADDLLGSVDIDAEIDAAILRTGSSVDYQAKCATSRKLNREDNLTIVVSSQEVDNTLHGDGPSDAAAAAGVLLPAQSSCSMQPSVPPPIPGSAANALGASLWGSTAHTVTSQLGALADSNEPDVSGVSELLRRAALVAAVRRQEEEGWLQQPCEDSVVQAIRHEQEDVFHVPCSSPQVCDVRSRLAVMQQPSDSPAVQQIRSQAEALRDTPLLTGPAVAALRASLDDPLSGYKDVRAQV